MIAKLTKPAGDQKFALKSNDLDGNAAAFNPLAEDLTIAAQVGANVVYIGTIAAGDPDWKVAGSKYKWKARSAPHPNGLSTVTLENSGQPFSIRVKGKDLDLTGASGVSQFDLILIVGDDLWFGPTPPCVLSGNGSSLKCR